MKIDYSYAKSAKWKVGGFLPFIIEGPALQIEKEEVPPFKTGGIFAHFDDEKIIFRLTSDKASHKGFSNILYIAAVLFVILMYLGPFITEAEIEKYSLTTNLIIFFIGSSFASCGLYLRLRASSFPDHISLTLYRLLGLIELPRDDQGKDLFVIPFKDLKALNRSITTPNVHLGPRIMFMRDASPYSFVKLLKMLIGSYPPDWRTMSWSNNPMEYWSFYVWYMDKNRPLPPGTAFDPYRKRDYERRKAEGFPPPLYESKIPTPEYVPGSEGSIADNLN